MKTQNKGRVVSSYSIQKAKSGIILVIFNTHDKWIDYHRYNDEIYKFTAFDDLEEIVNFESDPSIKVISEDYYQVADSQDKNQIIFYYIPNILLIELDKI